MPFSLNLTNVIVSAFVCGTNKRNDRSIDKYMELAKPLLQSSPTTLKICFLDPLLFSLQPGNSEQITLPSQSHPLVIKQSPNLLFVKYKIEDAYLYPFVIGKIDPQHYWINTSRPDKDTLEYMVVQNNKPEWMRLAVLIHQYLLDGLYESGHHHYIWMDFGIRHMFSSDAHLKQEIESLCTRSRERYDIAWANGHPLTKIHFASCGPDFSPQTMDVDHNIFWVFAGSVFGGMRGSILLFAELAKEKCLELIRNKNHIMWEVNVWIYLLRENPALFSLYPAAHDPSILIHF